MTVGHAELLEAYAQVCPALAARADALCRTLGGWLTDAGVKVHSVTARLKDPASLAKKLARPDRSYTELWSVTDLLGLRVIVYFEDAVDEVGRVLEARLPIDLARSNDKRARAETDAFGYRSLHYVFAVADSESLDGPLPRHARAEIQIRTLLEHTWAEIEHDLGYKAPGAVPAPIRRRLSRLAGMLEVADREFVSIRDELAEYTRALPRRIEIDSEHVPLDQLALAALVDSPEVTVIDRAIAVALEQPLSDELFFPDYLLSMLQAVGLRTAADVRASLSTRGTSLHDMARPYFQFAWQTWRLAPSRGDGLLRGYTLFFLAHAHLLAGASLQLDRVERLTRLYRELDYPTDPAEAQRVASALVEALRS